MKHFNYFFCPPLGWDAGNSHRRGGGGGSEAVEIKAGGGIQPKNSSWGLF